jgi:hypothetical protein
MKEPDGEGPASHADSESCSVVREDGGEALTGAHMGRVLSREILLYLRGADAVQVSGRPHPVPRYRERNWSPARSETPSTCGRTLYGNREVPCSPRHRSRPHREV